MKPYRSLLFVPGHRADWVDKALRVHPDAIILDLEDAVPEHLKAGARATVAQSIARLHEQGATTDVLVRVNPLATRLTGSDLEAVVVPGLTALFVPKVEGAPDVHKLDALVDHFELKARISGLEYVLSIETVPAIQNCRELALASPRVGALLGTTAIHADITRAVGFQWTPEGLETLYLRSRVLLACREAGLHPITGLWEDLANPDGLSVFAAQGRQLGFRGMIAIHPSQVAPINQAFSPSAEEISFYQGLARAYEEAVERGDGSSRYRGLHIDRAHYDHAVEWLDQVGQVTRHHPDAGASAQNDGAADRPAAASGKG